MWTEIIVISSVIGVLTVIGTIAWWKLADRWVDEEHKRFRAKPADPSAQERVVIVTRHDKDSRT